MKKNRNKHYHRDKCESKIRASITFGTTVITLTGKHAFEWSIIKEEAGRIIITSYPDRAAAYKAFDIIKKMIPC